MTARALPSLALAALLGSTLAIPGHAAQDPQAGRWDPRVRTVAYNPMNPVRLVGSTFVSTQIILGPTETITHVAIGDSDAWLAQPAGNLLFLKPVEVRAPTNMQVVTKLPDGTVRSYQFELVARPANTTAQLASLDGSGVPATSPATPFAIQFTYPADAREAAAAERREQAAAADQKRAEDRLAVDFFYGAARNWKYAAQGSTAIEPLEVSDNGQVTAMRFPGNRPVPSIYTISPDGQESIVPYNMRDDLAVVNTTAREFRLRYGGEVVRVINVGYDPTGVSFRTGTTSPEVVRTIRRPVRRPARRPGPAVAPAAAPAPAATPAAAPAPAAPSGAPVALRPAPAQAAGAAS